VSTQRESQELPSPASVKRMLQNVKVQAHEHVNSFLGVWGHRLLNDLSSTMNSGEVI
jgi:hypothetical protein